MDNALHATLGYDATNPHQDAPLSRKEFMSRWKDCIQGVGLRILTGRLSCLVPMTSFKEACVQVHKFAEFHINQAATAGIDQDNTSVGVSLLAQTKDRTLIRNMLVQGIIGAQDTTSVLTSNTIYLLARHPKLWDELREEVLKHGEELFTFDALRNNEVIQNLLSESKCPRIFKFL
jgi:cytochrome P450